MLQVSRKDTGPGRICTAGRRPCSVFSAGLRQGSRGSSCEATTRERLSLSHSTLAALLIAIST